MKLIDAEPIIKNLSAMKTQLGYDAIDIAGMIKALREAEEVTAAQQPNDPLTLEELREMDGEPVWVYNVYNGWCTCRVIDEMDANSIFFTDGMARCLKMYGNGWTAYRRKPEDKNNEPDSSC